VDLPSVIFLCTGNTYRSPLAETIFKKKLQERNLADNWNVKSAGTWTGAYLSADKNLVKIAAKYDLDLSQHLSTKIEDVDLEKFDLIVVMEAGQKEALVYEYPKIANQILMITELSGHPYDIQDPQGLGIVVLERVLKELVELIYNNFERLCKLVQTRNEKTVEPD
jgi:protein-tyrosine phosphatase